MVDSEYGHLIACALLQGAQADEADLEVADEDWMLVLGVEEYHVVGALLLYFHRLASSSH